MLHVRYIWYFSKRNAVNINIIVHISFYMPFENKFTKEKINMKLL